MIDILQGCSTENRTIIYIYQGTPVPMVFSLQSSVLNYLNNYYLYSVGLLIDGVFRRRHPAFVLHKYTKYVKKSSTA